MERTKLLRDIPEDIYREAVQDLERMRREHPSYRDDELLLYLLCSGRFSGPGLAASKENS